MHFVSLFKKYQLAILLTHKNIVSFINIPRNSDIEVDWRNPVSPIVLLSVILKETQNEDKSH